MRPFVILNPAARGISPAGAERTLRRLRKALIPLPGSEVHATTHPGEAARLARRAAGEGWDPIVAAGGDGVIGEVLGGLAPALDRVRLGVLPLGTGNDLARSLSIPRRLDAAVAALREGRERRVDAILLETPGEVRPVANALVAGFPGRVAARTDRARKRRWGALAYRRSTLSALRDLVPHRVRLLVDGSVRSELAALAVVVANGESLGGGIRVAPGARLDDGLLDVVVLPALSPARLLALLPLLLAGRPGSSRALVRRRARSVRLDATPPMALNADGEVLSPGPAALRILPGALRVIAPPVAGGAVGG